MIWLLKYDKIIKYICIRIFFRVSNNTSSFRDKWKVAFTTYSGFWYSMLFLYILLKIKLYLFFNFTYISLLSQHTWTHIILNGYCTGWIVCRTQNIIYQQSLPCHIPNYYFVPFRFEVHIYLFIYFRVKTYDTFSH